MSDAEDRGTPADTTHRLRQDVKTLLLVDPVHNRRLRQVMADA